MQDAIDLLKSDHQNLRKLLERISGHNVLEGEERERHFRDLEREIKMHALVEEEIFYPAFKEATQQQNDRDMYYEAIEEHHVVDMVLPELLTLDGSSEQFRAKAKVLRELIEHHADEEEQEMFARARELMPATKLEELGGKMERRKVELDSQWDSLVAGALRRAQSVADKFMPTSMKDLRAELNRGDRR